MDMTVTITFHQDESGVRSLLGMLMALEREGVLDEHDESVVESVVTSCYEQDSELDPDEVDEHIEEIRSRMK